MFCETCKKPFNASDPDLRCCPRCGWSLGRLEARWETDQVTLAGHRRVLARLSCRNAGRGKLRCVLGPRPDGVEPKEPLPPYWDVTDQPQAIDFELDPMVLPSDLTQLDISIIAQDGKGLHPLDFRPASVEKLNKDHPLPLRLQRRQFGPVHTYHQMLLFRSLQRKQKLMVQNLGYVEVNLTITAPPGYRLRWNGDDWDTHLSLMLAPKPNSDEVCIEALPPAQGGGKSGTLRVEVDHLPESSRDVPLVWLADPPAPTLPGRWIIGIDFGTAKTAVSFIDTNIPDSPPQLIRWRVSNRERLKVPSVIDFSSNSPFPRCGWDVPLTATGPGVIRSIKKRLTEERIMLADGTEQETEKIVEEYLRFIVSHVRQQPQFRSQTNPFQNATIVMSLPVLDNGVLYEEQKERTRTAAILAGLPGDRLRFFTEPECAATDFLRRREELGLAVQDGDLMCVFDCGAGTTDICVLEVHFDSAGQPQFNLRAQAGFPFGGDVVDELLTRSCLRKMVEENRLNKEQSAPDLTTYVFRGQEDQPSERTGLMVDLRAYKEGLPHPDPDRPETSQVELQYKYGPQDTDVFTLNWDLVGGLFQPYVESMLLKGFQEQDIIPDWLPGQAGEGRRIGQRLPSLLEVLRDANPRIPPEEIRWLCLTGGSSFMPAVIALLRRHLWNATLIPTLENIPALMDSKADAPMTLNVAQGASERPRSRVGGRLPADIGLQLHTSLKTETKWLLREGTPPGANSGEVALPLSASEKGELHVMATINGASGSIYVFPCENNDPNRNGNLLIHLWYESNMKLYLTVEIATASERKMLLDKCLILD